MNFEKRTQEAKTTGDRSKTNEAKARILIQKKRKTSRTKATWKGGVQNERVSGKEKQGRSTADGIENYGPFYTRGGNCSSGS